MAVQLINQLFKNYFNGGNSNGNGNILVSRVNSNTCDIGICSLSDCEKIRELKKYKAIFIHYQGEEDNGMDSEVIEAYSYDEAYSIACRKPGRLYKLTEL